MSKGMRIILKAMEDEEDVVLEVVGVDEESTDFKEETFKVDKVVVGIGGNLSHVDPDEFRRAAEALVPQEKEILM